MQNLDKMELEPLIPMAVGIQSSAQAAQIESQIGELRNRSFHQTSHLEPPNNTPQVVDWDLVTGPSGRGLRSFQQLGDEFMRITKLAVEHMSIVKEKKSLVLQDPNGTTWGNMTNNSIAFHLGNRPGPSAVRVQDSLNSPPNWIQTILGFKSGTFERLPDSDLEAYYRGNIQGYEIRVTKGEHRVLKEYFNLDFPSPADWMEELEATEAKLAEVAYYKATCERVSW